MLNYFNKCHYLYNTKRISKFNTNNFTTMSLFSKLIKFNLSTTMSNSSNKSSNLNSHNPETETENRPKKLGEKRIKLNKNINKDINDIIDKKEYKDFKDKRDSKLYNKTNKKELTKENLDDLISDFNLFTNKLKQTGTTNLHNANEAFNSSSYINDSNLVKHTNKSVDSEVVLESLYVMLKNKKLRDTNINQFIETLITLYKSVIETNHLSKYKVSYENFVNSKTNKNKKLIKKIEVIFTKNIVIDALNLIFSHLSEIKSLSFEKLIVLLVNIRHTNYNNWKKVLKQYNDYMTILKSDSDYRPMNFKSIVMCLSQFKNVHSFLTYFTDVDFENLLDKAIKESADYLLKNLDSNENSTKLITMVVNNCSRMGLLDSNNIHSVEKVIIKRMDEILPSDFIGILYSFCKNKSGSEGFYQVLEIKCRKIIMETNKENINPFVISMISKSLFVGLRKNKDILEGIQKLFMNYYNHFDIHHLGILGHSLSCMNACTEEFSIKLDELLLGNERSDLTEMITFQILLIILKNDYFCLNNAKKYYTMYKKLMNNNEIQQKQARTLAKHFRIKADRIQKLDNFKFMNEKESYEEYLNSAANDLDFYMNRTNI